MNRFAPPAIAMAQIDEIVLSSDDEDDIRQGAPARVQVGAPVRAQGLARGNGVQVNFALRNPVGRAGGVITLDSDGEEVDEVPAPAQLVVAPVAAPQPAIAPAAAPPAPVAVVPIVGPAQARGKRSCTWTGGYAEPTKKKLHFKSQKRYYHRINMRHHAERKKRVAPAAAGKRAQLARMKDAAAAALAAPS